MVDRFGYTTGSGRLTSRKGGAVLDIAIESRLVDQEGSYQAQIAGKEEDEHLQSPLSPYLVTKASQSPSQRLEEAAVSIFLWKHSADKHRTDTQSNEAQSPATWGLVGDDYAFHKVPERGLLGNVVWTSSDDKLLPWPESQPVFLNTHIPFCLVSVGVQGAGKSHTMGVVLENCLVPQPLAGVVTLEESLAALVFHYDLNHTNICEATGLIEPSADLQKLTELLSANSITSPDDSTAVSTPSGVPQVGPGSGSLPSPLTLCPRLERSKMVVLVSPSFYKQRRDFYGDYCEVRPLLFSWRALTARQIKILMRIEDTDSQLYVSSMLGLLRRYQRDHLIPSFSDFLKAMEKATGLTTQQSGPLRQRWALLEAIVAESGLNASFPSCYRGNSGDVSSLFAPGTLVIADLTDPMLSPEEANSIFQVLLEQFRGKNLNGCGKLLMLDEAHKFMNAQASDGLSRSLVDTVRLMRHEGMRIAISSQSPKVFASELLELISICLIHKFHSRDWFDHLKAKVPLPPSMFETITQLAPGNALVFSSHHNLPGIDSNALLKVQVRPRLTADRGGTRRNAKKKKKPV